MNRARLRDLGVAIGSLPTGPHNAITDVPGVQVGHATVIHDAPRVARTGVTVILPRPGDEVWTKPCFAGTHSFNGCGELTGTIYVNEFGLLQTCVALTNSHDVGVVRDAVCGYVAERGLNDLGDLPVVGETWDGWLSDMPGAHVKPEHVRAALAAAKGGPVAEGCVGAGTGTICHELKGGIGTSSRVATLASGTYTVGALVQSNYGLRRFLRVDGVPVGTALDDAKVPGPWGKAREDGSIIIIVATDAPLVGDQCARLARRATVGLARAGGIGANGSGDIFLAFSTGNAPNAADPGAWTVKVTPPSDLSGLFEATADAVEEAIVNSMTAAVTTTGQNGRTAHAIPLDELRRLMAGRVVAAPRGAPASSTPGGA